MKKLVILLCMAGMCFAQNAMLSDFCSGFMVMGGARYDNVRMCVGSAAGVKGGPIADVMFSTKYHVKQNKMLVFNFPVMRPLLFGIAFKMLQFEPELNMEIHGDWQGRDIYWGPGLGLSLNYSPDYLSDMDMRGPDFFSMGPTVNCQAGVEIISRSYISLKTFYTPLFRFDGGDNGMVLGLTGQFSKYF